MEFKENQQLELPNGSKLHYWLNDSDLPEPTTATKGILTSSNQQNMGQNIGQNTGLQKPNHPTDFKHILGYYPQIRIPPFMYTFMVSLISDCRIFEQKKKQIQMSIEQLINIFNTTKYQETKVDVNQHIIIYQSKLRHMFEKSMKVKINLNAAQSVIRQISIADHKDLLVKAAKHYASLAKQNPWNGWFKEIHRLITLEIKYVNHYEFHEMEEFKL
jgi:hypothetical protein